MQRCKHGSQATFGTLTTTAGATRPSGGANRLFLPYAAAVFHRACRVEVLSGSSNLFDSCSSLSSEHRGLTETRGATPCTSTQSRFMHQLKGPWLSDDLRCFPFTPKSRSFTSPNGSSTKVYVFSDSVLCLGRILQHPDSNEAWKN